MIIGSVILALFNQSITAMIAKKWRFAWLVLIIAQIPNSAYDLITRQYGFIFISVTSVFIGWKAWKSWK